MREDFVEKCDRFYRLKKKELAMQYGGMAVAIDGEKVVDYAESIFSLYEKWEKIGTPTTLIYKIPTLDQIKKLKLSNLLEV
jgi:hypothetical protein